MPIGFYSSGPTNQTFAKPHPTKDIATDLINQTTVVVTLGSWVEERALSRLEGLASNPKEWFEIVALSSLNATTSFKTQVPTPCIRIYLKVIGTRYFVLMLLKWLFVKDYSNQYINFFII